MRLIKICLLVPMIFSLMSDVCFGQTAEDFYNKGVGYGVNGKFEEAQGEFKKALGADQLYSQARGCLKIVEDVLNQRIKVETALYLFKGIAFADKEMYNEAISEYKKAIETNPQYAEAHYNLGNAYYGKGMFDKWKYNEAIAEYKKAIEINPQYAEAHNSFGKAYYQKKMYDEAISEYKKAIEINPQYAEAHYNLGMAYGRKRMYDEASAEYKKAIEIDPKFAEIH